MRYADKMWCVEIQCDKVLLSYISVRYVGCCEVYIPISLWIGTLAHMQIVNYTTLDPSIIQSDIGM